MSANQASRGTQAGVDRASGIRIVPALGRDRLTGIYDPVVRLTTRER